MMRSLILVSLLVASSILVAADYIPPFTADLHVGDSGHAVTVLQIFLSRAPSTKGNLAITGTLDSPTAAALVAYQSSVGLTPSCSPAPCADEKTQNALYSAYQFDHYKDDLKAPLPAGIKYKVHIPVHRDRTIEVQATLYNASMDVLRVFTVRAHGQQNFTEFASDGNTPSGLSYFDLNSPEDDPDDYGPYPVNRATVGIAGNAAVLIPNVRNGILMHTGNWTQQSPMPNSHGCVHAHIEDIYAVWQLLVNECGVEVRPNPFGKLPYPYVPQGLLSIECVDC
jgi:hypothetical protein